jgi:hypothetical protein
MGMLHRFTRLWERTSSLGTHHMSGRLGGVKVVILPNRDYVEGHGQWPHPYAVLPGRFVDAAAASGGARAG